MIPIAKPMLGDEERRAVAEVLESGILAQGPRVKAFENAFANYIGTKYAVATSSGTTALHTALLACGIKSGDEVITTPFTFIASANAILYCNAKPVFADIDERTFNIDPEEVKERITRRTKALLVVHLYGQPCDMRAITEICEDYNLKLIEDACQAHGAEYKGRKVGSFGDAACFSFYPTKNMTTGEGGMLTTSSREVAERARLIREHGSRVRYEHIALGYNYRMTDIAAAIGLVQLTKLEEMNAKRRANAERLSRELEGVDGITPPYVAPYAKHVFHQYTVRVEDRAEVIRRLEAAEIGYGIHYPKPVHRQELYLKLGYEESLPRAEEASREVLSLPVHPALSDAELERIARVVKGI